MSNTHIDIQQIYWAKKHKNLHRSPPHEKQEVKFILNNLVRIVGFYNFVKNRTMSHQTGIKGKEIFQQYGNQIYLSCDLFFLLATANEKSLKVFGKAKSGKLRVIKISIENGKCKRNRPPASSL